MSEPSGVLLLLLQLLYPATSPQLKDYAVTFELVTAYDKYMIDVKSLLPYLNETLLEKDAFSKHPLEVYSLAWKLDLQNVALEASRYLHESDLKSAYVQSHILSRTQDYTALTALWDLRERRHIGLDNFIQQMPLATFSKSFKAVTLNCSHHISRMRQPPRHDYHRNGRYPIQGTTGPGETFPISSGGSRDDGSSQTAQNTGLY